ncbi:MAG: HAMP domain-containing protein [Chlorobiaceae bacterium]|nr:HAMP domain-containing protein [Chlorobiaceae bacterium]NTW74019.1 HAMP domain-containing protein [Chlorobiaceae bacterium]
MHSPGGPPGVSGRRMFPAMSLRNRIALYYTGTTAVLMAVVFALIFLTVDRVVYSHFDEELRHEVSETLSKDHVQEHDICEFDRLKAVGLDEARVGDRLHSSQDIKKVADIDPDYVQLVDSNGQIVSRTANLARNVLIFTPSYSGVRFYNAELAQSTMRQVQVPLVDRSGTVKGYLIVAVPLKSAMMILRDLKYIVIAWYPVIIIALFGLTRLIASRSIRPIEEVIATAESITQANFDRRMPLPARQDELYRLSATINALLDRLQDAFRREKQFTADASHELKTPLAVVKGTLDVLVRKPRDVVHYEDRVRYCLDELNRMARLIDQLLLLARSESDSSSPNIAPVDVGEVIATVLSRVEPLAAARHRSIDTKIGFSGRVSADPAMLEMMLANILSNALKYSPEGSVVEIRTGAQNGTAFCTIADHGIGIPDSKLQSIFDRFYRVDESRSSSTGGSGLGLSIVRRLADLQHIGVEVSSREKLGTTFTLIFPVVRN